MTVLDAVPVPTELTADTLKLYEELFVSPVTVAVVLADVPSANVDQEPSAANLYSTM